MDRAAYRACPAPSRSLLPPRLGAAAANLRAVLLSLGAASRTGLVSGDNLMHKRSVEPRREREIGKLHAAAAS